MADWDRFVALADRARRCDEEVEEASFLDQALELIDGPPFRGATGYSWAYSDGTGTLTCDAVRAVVVRVIDLHRSRDDQPKAARACHRARVLLDGDIGSDTTQTSASQVADR
jgi:hypothetical protein